MITRLLGAWFGEFEKNELRKYLFLGFIFLFIVGTYWTLRPLKDAFFGGIVIGYGQTHGQIYLALAKIVSLLLLFPAVLVYSYLVERFKKDRFFYMLCSFYVLALIAWWLFWSHPSLGLSNTSANAWRICGWLWYVFVESYGSLVIALFWAFTVDISTSQSAKRGFPLVVLVGQVGGIIFPWFLPQIPRLLGTSSAPVVGMCSVLTLCAIFFFWLFIRTTPADQLEGYHGRHLEKRGNPGLFEGLRLLVTHRYLLGIFSILAFFEFIVTVIDFNFKTLVFSEFDTTAAASEYLGLYGASVNMVVFLSLLFGISNIQRVLGLRVALGLVPVVIGCAIFAFKLFPVLDVLFCLMVSSKALNYALNSPSIKQLYVPTSTEVKYKSQAWIETFGSRSAKAAASVANLSRGVLGFSLYLAVTVYFSLIVAVVWFVTALFLAKRHEEAVERKELVC